MEEKENVEKSEVAEVEHQQVQKANVPPKKNNYLYLIIIVVVFLVAVIGGFLFLGSGVFKEFNKVKNDVEKEIEKKDEIDITDKKSNVREIDIKSDEVDIVLKKFITLGLSNARGYITDQEGFESTIGIQFSEDWYAQERLDVDELNIQHLIKTATNNLDTKKAIFCGNKDDKVGTYSMQEINTALQKVIYNKTITLEDIKNNQVEANDVFEVKGNDIYLNLSCDGNCCGPTDITYAKTYKAEKEEDKIYIYQKVAFCKYNKEVKANNPSGYSSEYNCFKDSKVSDLVETRLEEDNPAWDKYNTYKVTFKEVQGNYYFDNYELVK